MEWIKRKYISTIQQSFPAINTIQERPTGVATLLFQDNKSLDMKTVLISTKKNKYLLILLEEVIGYKCQEFTAYHMNVGRYMYDRIFQ
jgi:hypothetical protein